MNSRLSAFATLSCVSLAAAPQPLTLGAQAAGDARWTSHHEHVLGTSLELTVRAADRASAAAAEAAALRSIDRDETMLSTWRADSEASRWARTSMQPVPVSPELLNVLAAFDTWRERTGGALDASVEAATRLWSSTTARGRTPTPNEISVTVEAMQQPHWSLDRVHGTAMRLTDVPLAFATFVKSSITDRAAKAALAAGASGVMLNVGGDVVVRGSLTQIIAVADPHAASENDVAVRHVVVRDAAVATSGSYRRGFELAGPLQRQEPGFSHLIDPRTAMPASHVVSSTVVAQDAETAGALATAFAILPVAQSHALAAAIPGVQYLLLLASGGEVRTSGFPAPNGLQPVAYAPAAANTPAAGMWNPAFTLNIDLELPRIADARYRRPYVAVWVEDADHFPVRTLALWTQNPRWLPDLKQWYRDDQLRRMAEGTDVSRTITSATRPPGKYNLKWDGKDNEGKPVKAGKYTICVEASREHGGYDVERHELDLGATPLQATLAGAKELGAITLDYRKR